MSDTGVDTQKLLKKLVEVGAAIDSIEKTGTNKGLGFKFVEASHAYNAIRAELYKRNVFMMIGLGDVAQHDTLTHVQMNVTFIDADTGASVMVPWHGYGSDRQDKGMAKAITSGIKSLLLTQWLIPSGIEPDADSGTDIASSGTKANKVDGLDTDRLLNIVALAKERGIPDTKVRTKINALGAQRAADMTVDQADKLEAWIKRQKVEGSDA
jgi:hypothetical protein